LTDDMPKKRPLYIRHERTRHKKWVWYFRRGRQRVRLPDEYGTDAFWEAYSRALSGKAGKAPVVPHKGSLAWLVARYKESGHFAGLKPSTRRMRDNIMQAVCKKYGHVEFAAITQATMTQAMEDRAKTPHAANNFLKVFRKLFQWAVKNGYLQVNPCVAVERISVQSDGFHAWTLDQVEKYQARHPVGTKARLALDLLLYTGLRRSDIVTVGRQHVRDGVIVLKTQKTGSTVYIPIFPKLRESIDATKTGDLAFLSTASGRPFGSAASFGNWFAARCEEAGLPKECRAHGLRKAGATMAAEEGATVHELMAMYGWTRTSMAEVYTKEADRRRLAVGAAKRIANKLAPHLDPEQIFSYDKTIKTTA
jgi:integrase